jgi:hypothetical protein
MAHRMKERLRDFYRICDPDEVSQFPSSLPAIATSLPFGSPTTRECAVANPTPA